MIYFIGGGPGDPELLTIKAKRIIDSADIIIYAGSLVNPAVLVSCRDDAEIYDSAGMNLDEVMEVMLAGDSDGKTVARVHTGDPSIYGAIREQIDILEKQDIPYEVIPGVSSFVAAAAALGREYTLPAVSQTVILTRRAGRTPVPDGEDIISLAAHQATMVIFLSVGQIEALADELVAGGYDPTTPVAVVSRATWPDQKIIVSQLDAIAEKVKEAGITRQALVTVGHFLGDEFELSKLYDRYFTHGYRRGEQR
ncbi:MAG TPA: precorrin-4 C(11)-methyltransferase [Clostridiaceae bacterium]|nr:precorrin-4 C(11)-methyltransferase [Clostridiaceae bacterium]